MIDNASLLLLDEKYRHGPLLEISRKGMQAMSMREKKERGILQEAALVKD
jgi:hypothetical protein